MRQAGWEGWSFPPEEICLEAMPIRANRRPKTADRVGHAPDSVAGSAVVYPARVSDKPPQTYILHTVVLFIVIVIAMVLFLKHQWG